MNIGDKVRVKPVKAPFGLDLDEYRYLVGQEGTIRDVDKELAKVEFHPSVDDYTWWYLQEDLEPVTAAWKGVPAPGVKADEGKMPWASFPWAAARDAWKSGLLDVFTGIMAVVSYGIKKYKGHPPDNWKRVPNAKERYASAAIRHIIADLEGERFDPESGLLHLDHAGCNIAFLREINKQTTPPESKL